MCCLARAVTPHDVLISVVAFGPREAVLPLLICVLFSVSAFNPEPQTLG